MKKKFLLLSFILQAVLLCSCTRAALLGPKKEASLYSEKQMEIAGPAVLSLDCDSSNIEIYTWDRKDVKFEITRRLRTMADSTSKDGELQRYKVDLDEKNGSIVYKSRCDVDRDSPADRRIDLKLYLPRGSCSLDIRLGVGSVKVYDDFKGEFTAKVGMATMEINRLEGPLQVQGEMGDLRIGSGILKGICSVKVEMGNLDIHCEDFQGESASFETGMGNINMSISEAFHGRIDTIGNVERSEDASAINSTSVIKLQSDMGKITVERF